MTSRDSAAFEITPEVLLRAYACGIFPMAESADDPALSGIALILNGLINRTVSTWNGAVVVDDTHRGTPPLIALFRAAGESVGSYIITGGRVLTPTGTKLPFTGGQSGPLLILGILFLAGGAALTLSATRGRRGSRV